MNRLIKGHLQIIPALAKQTAKSLKDAEIIGLVGPLGSGKTAFVKALGKRLKIRGPITSPSFGLMNIFTGKLNSKKITVYHLDLYRTKNFNEIKALGILEFWGKPGTLTLIEWANKIKKHLPKKTKLIEFSHRD